MALNWARRKIFPLSQSALLSLAVAASKSGAGNVDARRRLAKLQLASHQYFDAIQTFNECLVLDGRKEFYRRDMAQAYIGGGSTVDALRLFPEELKSRNLPKDGTGVLLAVALIESGQIDMACEFLRQAIDQNQQATEALEILFASCIRNGNLPYFNQLRKGDIGARFRHTAVFKGYEAVYLSLVGNAEAARRHMKTDLVRMIEVESPQAYPNLEHFNSELAGEIKLNADLYTFRTETFRRSNHIGYDNEPALKELIRIIKKICEAYLNEVRAIGDMHLLPSIPNTVDLVLTANILEGNDGHSSHLHRYGILSGTYYVRVPVQSKRNDSENGRLKLGSLDGLVTGHETAWPTMSITPKPGLAVIFPSHLFHSVAPTRSAEQRIAVAFDVVPAES